MLSYVREEEVSEEIGDASAIDDDTVGSDVRDEDATKWVNPLSDE